MAGARRLDARGPLQRDLLHRAREVHRVRRLPRPGGVRRGVPRGLLRPQPGHPRDARRASGPRTDPAPRGDDRRRRAVALHEGGAGRARPSPWPPGSPATRRPLRPRHPRRPVAAAPCQPSRPPPVSRSPRPRTGRCRSTASGATASTRCPFPTYRAGTVFRCPYCLGSFVPTLSMVRGVAEALGAVPRHLEARLSSASTSAGGASSSSSRSASGSALSRFEQELRGVAARERAPGAPTKRRAVLVVLIGPGGGRRCGGGFTSICWNGPRARRRTSCSRWCSRAGAAIPSSASGSSTSSSAATRASRSIPTTRRWRARAHDDLARPLADQEFVVVDLETTGGGIADGGITEIGAVRVSNGRLVDTFATLVNPGRRDPAVRRGADRHHRRDGGDGAADRRGAAALPRVRGRRRAGGAQRRASTSGHLDAAHRALDRPRARPARALHDAPRAPPAAGAAPQLARRRRGGARHRLLRSPSRPRRRAHRGRDPVRLPGAAAERGVARVGELLALQRRRQRRAAASSSTCRASVSRRCPRRRACTICSGEDGRLLYVGKARRLRERVGNWFSNARGHSRRALELIRQVHDVRVIETGSELAASLLEMRQIRELKPPYNRQARQLPRVAFLRLTAARPVPAPVRHATARHRPRDLPRAVRQRRRGRGRAEPSWRACSACARAPGGSRRRPRRARACSVRSAPVPAPCAARIDAAAYRRLVETLPRLRRRSRRAPRARADGTSRRRGGRAALRGRRRARSATCCVLEDLRRRRERLQWILARQNFAVLLPTADRDGRAALRRARRPARRRAGRAGRGRPGGGRRSVVRERFARYQDAPLERGDVAASTILSAWLRDRAQEGVLLPLDGPDALAERLDELVVTLHDLRQRGPLPADRRASPADAIRRQPPGARRAPTGRPWGSRGTHATPPRRTRDPAAARPMRAPRRRAR